MTFLQKSGKNSLIHCFQWAKNFFSRHFFEFSMFSKDNFQNNLGKSYMHNKNIIRTNVTNFFLLIVEIIFTLIPMEQEKYFLPPFCEIVISSKPDDGFEKFKCLTLPNECS